jgi:uncharacterized protein (DUF1501 family)
MITVGADVRNVDPVDVPKHHPFGPPLASIAAVAQFDERLREARKENDALDHTGQALADALKLQQNTQQRAAAPTKHGRRRKGQVIDLDQRTFIKPKRRRLFKTFLILEASAAVIAVAVLVIYLVTHHNTVT